jgi:hypothetical protein
MRGVPQRVRSDNGHEFFARVIQRWTNELKIDASYREPGSHWENDYADSLLQ